MSEKSGDVIKSLMKMGMMATINESLDADTAELLVTEFGHKFVRENIEDVEKDLIASDQQAVKDKIRPPIVTIMGHVDHGKTSLLDYIRKSNVVSGESGGITQHIGAYQVNHDDKKITFIDTPGHAAFTEMRARGANVTDIVILIVAADDGVMPQTKEAISHAKSANVPIIVAINKCDKPESNPQKIKEQLLSEEIIVEDLSGDIQCIEVSAQSGQNIDKLLESILLQAELSELKANETTHAEGVVIEANIDKGRGPICNIVLTNGLLKVGHNAVAGSEMGKVRAILNDKGDQIKEAFPSMPVQVLGLGSVPEAGDGFIVVDNEDKARELCELRSQIQKNKSQNKKVKFVENDFAFGDTSSSKELVEVVLKSDTRGSTEAIVSQLEDIVSEKVLIKVIHSGVGLINESDVSLAMASDALLIAFNTSATKEAKEKARSNKLNVSSFQIIYELIEYVSDFATGKLKPKFEENYLGRAEILKVFKVSKIGSIAGCIVSDGVVDKKAKAKVIRNNETIYSGDISSLMREKNEANEVKAGTECGIGILDYQDYKEGDIIEIFNVSEVSQTL
jgi:translation initiation factor IF-2